MYKQIELSYNYNALEPHIDELTMITHYTKHHATYTNNLNAAVEKLPKLSGKPIEEVFIRLPEISDTALKTAITNNGGGFYNHNLYFSTLSPKGGGKPDGKLAGQIKKDFVDFNSLKEKLSATATATFGSGWAWLSANKNGDLKISSTSNQNNPIMESLGKWIPILGIDVWEHAYYLKYKNVRADYIKALFEVIDWKEVANNYSKVINK